MRDALRMLRETDPNFESSFWTLFANSDKLDETFRQESMHYVPGFFAVAIIGENPAAFGISVPPLSSLANPGYESMTLSLARDSGGRKMFFAPGWEAV